MAEFLKTSKRRSHVSEVVYYVLNISLVAVLFAMSQTIQSPVLAIVLVLLSKWRMFAVRPRYWWTNVQANMVDIIVGVSIVTLMYLPQAGLQAQVILALLYALWLTLLKPLSKARHMLAQAAVAVFFGVTALYSVSYEWPVALTVFGMFVIGYSATRHFLFTQEEEQITLLSAIWALIFAEIGWLAHYWAFGYAVPWSGGMMIPQVTIIVLLLSFVGERVYRSWSTHGRVVPGEVALPAVFVAALLAVMLVFFNSAAI